MREGARREFCEPAKALLKKWEEKNLGYLTKSPPDIWSLYGLARYYELIGEKPTSEVMACCREIVARSLEHRDWATLYWRRGHTPAFNAVHGVNQLFAGLIGYIRLARLAGDKDAENLGWGLFARTAALRLAMGKYTQYMHEAHLFNVYYDSRSSRRFKNATPQDLVIKVETDPARYTLPDDPAWWVKRHAGDWIGELVTWNWSRPIDDVRQVHRLDETGVDVWEWCGTDCYGTGQKRDASEEKDYWYMRLGPYLLPFRDMVPELGRFMADHLKAESEAFCRRVVENQPHWYVTYAEAILSAEIGFNMPCDAYGQFLARAWILGEKPAQLERYIDVPWLKTGDLYYLHKLTETVRAYRAVEPATKPETDRPGSDTAAGWTKCKDNPVLGGDLGTCFDVCLLHEEGSFRMWFSYEPNAIGYATSPDGLTWTRYPDNPIFPADPGSDWERHKVTACQVVRQGDWHVMFYIGFRDEHHAQIGLRGARTGSPAGNAIRPNPSSAPAATNGITTPATSRSRSWTRAAGFCGTTAAAAAPNKSAWHVIRARTSGFELRLPFSIRDVDP